MYLIRGFVIFQSSATYCIIILYTRTFCPPIRLSLPRRVQKNHRKRNIWPHFSHFRPNSYQSRLSNPHWLSLNIRTRISTLPLFTSTISMDSINIETTTLLVILFCSSSLFLMIIFILWSLEDEDPVN